ncbi:DUF3575 domain-containing protein [Massilibacteroides vaginae]|uniref:DUF3575 domain-containing protein n=1 Tax=Massilibacteroides vaginae TaxID=1673718 RepID=UPI000A1CADB3|nr:DUF3575 domain-containing protein [Massilibacteroides vaginae]
MKTKHLLFTLLLCFSFSGAKAQFYSASTNVIGLATTNINAELSMTLNRTWSLHVPVQYNPFVFSENRRFQNLTVMPGVRYWLRETYAGSFFGMYAIASRYHVGNIWDDYRYDGKAFGAGLSYGKAYTLSPRWNFEWEIGAGVVWADYEKFACKKCGVRLGKENGVYFIPTKVAASLIYLF